MPQDFDDDGIEYDDDDADFSDEDDDTTPRILDYLTAYGVQALRDYFGTFPDDRNARCVSDWLNEMLLQTMGAPENEEGEDFTDISAEMIVAYLKTVTPPESLASLLQTLITYFEAGAESGEPDDSNDDDSDDDSVTIYGYEDSDDDTDD